MGDGPDAIGRLREDARERADIAALEDVAEVEAELRAERAAREAAERALAYQEQRTRDANDRTKAAEAALRLERDRAEGLAAQHAARLAEVRELLDRSVAAAERAEAAEAGAAGLREALEEIADTPPPMDAHADAFVHHDWQRRTAEAALRDTAGQAFLERLEKAERERASGPAQTYARNDADMNGAHNALVARVRREALEEAARVADAQTDEPASSISGDVARHIAAGIRALAAETKEAT